MKLLTLTIPLHKQQQNAMTNTNAFSPPKLK